MGWRTKLLSADQIDVAARLLLEGELVAFPTETVYGLGARLFDEKAIQKIYVAKGSLKTIRSSPIFPPSSNSRWW